MIEYIERGKAIKLTCEDCNKLFPEEPCEPSDCTIMQNLRSIPAADVRPVVRGKWIDYQQGRFVYAKCPKCETVHDVRSNFCPNCGAMMDMREEHDD